MRPSSPTDFSVLVDGIGDFRFAQKNLRVQMEVEAEFCRLTEGMDNVTTYFGNLCSVIAELKTLTTAAPDGWDLDTMDPEDNDTYNRIFKVWGALRDKQKSFRKGTAVSGEGSGKAS